MDTPVFEPEPTIPMTEAARVVMAESGPKCAECGKPYRLSAQQGGCGCKRYVGRKDNLSSQKNLALRQAEATERLALLLECYLKSAGVDVPDAKGAPAETSGTVADTPRAKNPARAAS